MARRARSKGLRWGRRLDRTVRVLDTLVAAPSRPTGITDRRYRRWAADAQLPPVVPATHVHILEDVLLHVPTGVIASADGRLVVETSHGSRRTPRDPIPSSYPSHSLSPGARLATTIMFLAADNYHHWLCDCLTRLIVLEQVLQGRPFDLLVPVELAPFQRELLTRVAGSGARVHAVASPWVRIRQLAWPEFLAPPGTAALPTDLLRTLRDRLDDGGRATEPEPAAPRLYVSRSACRHRRILNEAALLRELEPFELTLIRPEQLTLDEQIRAFRQARLVVAPRGAGLANMLFADGLKVVEISSRQRTGYGGFALSLAASLGHEYSRIPAAAVDDDYVVDPAVARMVVAAVLSAKSRATSDSL